MRLGRRARYLLLGVIGVVVCSVVWAWLDELGRPVGLPPFEPGELRPTTQMGEQRTAEQHE